MILIKVNKFSLMPCESKKLAGLLLYPNFKFVPRMFGRKDVFLFVNARMCVNLRCGNGAVSEHLLNISDINIFFKQERCKRVTKHMRSNV